MEPLFQLVGSIVAPRPAAELIDAFVLLARRERASVLAKSALGATFVRFNASDLRLVALACQAVRDAAPSPLRFGFAVGLKESSSSAVGPEGPDISTRSLEQAQELAAVARGGQVLVSPQLAAALMEAGFVLQSRQFRRPGGRTVAACLVGLNSAVPGELLPEPMSEPSVPAGPGDPFAHFAQRPGSPAALLQGAAGLDTVMQALAAQADELARRQAELETRQQLLQGRLTVVEEFERRVERLQGVIDAVETAVAEQLPRLEEIDGLRSQCDAVVGQLAGAQRTLASVAELQLQFQQHVQPLAAQVAGVESRLDELARGAGAVEQKILDIAERDAALQALKAELDTLEQIGQRSRADLDHLRDHRSDITELRVKVDDLLGHVDDTDRKIASIEARRKGVEEVQARTASISHMLGDIQIHQERLNEQRVVIDQVGERLARLDFTLQEAQNTLRALQRERDASERTEQSLKALRARSVVRPPA
jgi:predicted  nucleic acid-binding Zn-ribbon protein